ncbi:MAG: CDP-glycerol glycerophosphotransferase family protein, partial [Christensenellaceae bacterium]|nr:CDP-glycerol glycerophosphotransferase family protein [Christensenellaceae bacterium]
VFHPHCRLYAEFAGNKYELVPNDRYTLTKFFGRSAYKHFSFHVSIPMGEGEFGQVRFFAEDENYSAPLKWRFTFAHSKLTQRLKASYWRAGGRIFTMNGEQNALLAKKSGFFRALGHELKLYVNMLGKGHGSRKLAFKAMGLRWLYWLTRPFYAKRHIWVMFDKLYKGGDCGEYFYRYACAQDDGIHKQYILNGDSPFFPMLKKEGYKPTRRTSARQLLGFLNADIIFATHTNIYSFCSFGGKIEFFFRDLYNFDVTCIQHGLTTQAIAMYQHKLKDNTKRYYCASKYEIGSLEHPVYGYDPADLCLTGVPRHDGLVNRAKKQILLTPTWRQNLALPSIMGTARRYNVEFKNSTYYKYLNELIHDEALLSCARKNGYTLKYLLHPAVSVQAEDFSVEGIDDVVEILTGSGDLSYEQLLTESALMITDYSGVQFDFAYQRKPIVYYHHAEIPPHYEEGCFDYATMAFGEICTDNPTTVAVLIDYMENDCRMKEQFIARADDFFAYSDHGNCARIYADAMEHLQAPRMAKKAAK